MNIVIEEPALPNVSPTNTTEPALPNVSPTNTTEPALPNVSSTNTTEPALPNVSPTNTIGPVTDVGHLIPIAPAAPVAPVNRVNPVNNKKSQIFLAALSAVALSYCITLAIYQSIISVDAGNLVQDYAGYYIVEYVNGVIVSKSMLQLPRNLYLEISILAYIFLVTSSFTLVAVLFTLISLLKKNAILNYTLGIMITIAFVTLLPFIYCTYLTWKLHSFSATDEAIWDSVDTRFIGTLYKAQNVFYETLIPGVFWFILIHVLLNRKIINY